MTVDNHATSIPIRPRRSVDVPAIACVVSVITLFLALSIRRVWGVDFWWQWKTGEFVAQHGPPQVDVFSFTVAGAAWIELRWMYCWILYQATELLGFAGPVLLKTIVLALAFLLATAGTIHRRNLLTGAVVVGIAVLASGQRFLIRPEVATFFFFAFDLWATERFRRRGGRSLWLIPAVQIVWCATHTEFLLGPCIVGLFAAVAGARWLLIRSDEAQRRAAAHEFRRAAICTALTIAACFATPYGWRGVEYALHLAVQVHGTAYKEYLTELRGPFSFDADYTALAFYKAFLVLCIVAVVARPRRVDPYRFLLALSQGYLSVVAIRNIPLFCLAGIPLVISQLSGVGPGVTARRARAHLIVRAIVAIAFIVTCLGFTWDLVTDRFNIRQGDTNQFGIGLAEHIYPIAAEQFIRDGRLPDPIFSTTLESSYLIARDHRVFLDGRVEVYGEERFRRLMRMIAEPAEWRAAAREFGFRTALVDVQSPLFFTLIAEADWAPTYVDEVAAVFVRRDSLGERAPLAAESAVRDAVARVRGVLPRPRAWDALSIFESATIPTPYLRFGAALAALHFPDLAEPFLRDSLAAYPRTAGARRVLGEIAEGRGDFAAARIEFESELRVNPTDSVTQIHLALIAARQGRWSEAKQLSELALRRAPRIAAGWFALAGALATEGQVGSALDAATRAVSLEPENIEYVHLQGRLLSAAGRHDEAIVALLKVVAKRPDDLSIYVELIASNVDAGRTGEARDWVERGLRRWPEDPTLRALRDRLNASGGH